MELGDVGVGEGVVVVGGFGFECFGVGGVGGGGEGQAGELPGLGF